MLTELLHTPFPTMVAICFWWFLAYIIAANIANFLWWIAMSPFKGIAALWNGWRDNVRLEKEFKRKQAVSNGAS